VGGKLKSHYSFTFRLPFSILYNFAAFIFAVFLQYTIEREEKPCLITMFFRMLQIMQHSVKKILQNILLAL